MVNIINVILILMMIENSYNIKGILHQKNFYRLNLIFWIVMGCASKPLRRPSKPHGAVSRGPWGQNENPKMLSFGGL